MDSKGTRTGHRSALPTLGTAPLKPKEGLSGPPALQGKVENIFSVPVSVNARDCIVVIYGRSGNGATDNETQVHALIAP